MAAAIAAAHPHLADQTGGETLGARRFDDRRMARVAEWAEATGIGGAARFRRRPAAAAGDDAP